MKLFLGFTALATTGVLALTGCSGSPTSGGSGAEHANAAVAQEVYTKFDGLTGPDRMAQLVAAAEQEGVLSLYTTLTPDSAVAVEKAFESTYKIDIQLTRASSEAIISRIQNEQKAGYKKGNDVAELNGFELTALASEGYLADFNGPERDLVIEDGKHEGWTADRLNWFVPSRNTNLVSDADWPRRLEDYAAPKYAGKLSLEVNEVDWFMTLHDYYTGEKGMSEDEFLKMFKKIQQNSVAVDGHAPQIEQLSAGQFGVALSTYDYQAAEAAAKGAPVSFDPIVQPVVQRANGVALMKSAPHPNAAYLFYVWILTDGQQVMRDVGLKSSLAADTEKAAESGLEIVNVDVDKLLKEHRKFTDMYDSLFH